MDTTRVDGLAMAALQTIIADIENRNRAHRLLSGRIDNFQKKDWTAWYNAPPFGYKWDDEEDDDSDATSDDEEEDEDEEGDSKKWIRVDEEKVDIVKDVFRVFVHEAGTKKPYKVLDDRINPRLDEPLTRSQMKRILKIVCTLANRRCAASQLAMRVRLGGWRAKISRSWRKTGQTGAVWWSPEAL